MNKDNWHYPRLTLARQVLGMFSSGLSSALVFFAPRRMGKTEFLLKDIRPLAAELGYRVLYFSFLECSANAESAFISSLENLLSKSVSLNKKVKKISAGAGSLNVGVELKDLPQQKYNLHELFAKLTTKNKKVLLLLDEVQVIAVSKNNRDFVAALRTVLDVNKDNIKVIFTGSSREGLRRMFAKSDAPFFHFGQNLPFPEFDQGFTSHLAKLYQKTTGRNVDANELWQVFIELGKVPQLIRSLVERLVLQPDLSLAQAKEQMLLDVTNDRGYLDLWDSLSALEKIIIKSIAAGDSEFFSVKNRISYAAAIGVEDLSISTMQSTVRVLQRKCIIGSSEQRGRYFIDDPNFANWLLSMN